MTRASLWPALWLAALASAAGAEDKPLSAIDWLSDSVAAPAAAPAPSRARPPEPPAVRSATPAPVTVEPLDRPDPAAAGLIRPETVGLPRGLWTGHSGGHIAALLPQDPASLLPASRDALVALVSVEADPPASEGRALLLARIDALLRMGDLTRAARLMEAAGLTDPEVFRRWFDTELLTNNGNRACSRLRALPDVSPTYSARIFCLARGGDWPAAALTLETAEALNMVGPAEADLLARFLETEMFEGEEPLPIPDRPTPLTFAMFEAIGQSIPTAALPIAFAHADLRPVTGWKGRIEASERLARAGALRPAVLFDTYAERRPAASGGVWERVEAIQELDAALDDENVLDVGPALDRAWSEMKEAGLATAFAEVYSRKLLSLPRDSAPQDLVAEIGLLGPDPVRAAERLDRSPAEATLADLANGRVPAAASGLGAALASGFAAPLDAGAAGVSAGADLLRALDRIEAGREGNAGALTEGIVGLRQLGLTDTARRVALQVMLLESLS